MGISITHSRLYSMTAFRWSLCAWMAGAVIASAADSIPRWSRFERTLESSAKYENPVQEASLTAWFISPGGQTNKVYGFWDGGTTWRVRFAPNQTGKWTWRTECSDAKNSGLHQQSGEFTCAAPAGED